MRLEMNDYNDVTYVSTRLEAAGWLTAICHRMGLQQFQLKLTNYAIEGSAMTAEPAPMRAEIRALFSDLLGQTHGSIATRMNGSALPFWAPSNRSAGFPGMREAGPIGQVLCCPLRFGAARRAVALFYASQAHLDLDDLLLLQGKLVQLAEQLEGGAPHGQEEIVLPELDDDDLRCLSLLAAGEDLQAIASQLGYDDHRLSARLKIMHSRLGARSLSHSIAIGIRAGLI